MNGNTEEKAKASLKESEPLLQFKAVEELDEKDKSTIKDIIDAFIKRSRLKILQHCNYQPPFISSGCLKIYKTEITKAIKPNPASINPATSIRLYFNNILSFFANCRIAGK